MMHFLHLKLAGICIEACLKFCKTHLWNGVFCFILGCVEILPRFYR